MQLIIRVGYYLVTHLFYIYKKRRKPCKTKFSTLRSTGDERIEKDINPLITQYFQAF